MALVASIGERHLWVDRLCIVQDDDENKMTAINQMDVIYENALFTIIAAEGEDASAGLPGVGSRPRTRTQRCDVVGPQLQMIVAERHDAIFQTKWASRAWTYARFQEYLASPRRLIFANGQVIFRCSWGAPFREDIASEHQIFGFEDCVYKLNGESKIERQLLKNAGLAGMSHYFPLLVELYSERHLSNQSDAINAFAGLAAMMKIDCGVETCYGLIPTALPLSMAWSPKSRPGPHVMLGSTGIFVKEQGDSNSERGERHAGNGEIWSKIWSSAVAGRPGIGTLARMAGDDPQFLLSKGVEMLTMFPGRATPETKALVSQLSSICQPDSDESPSPEYHGLLRSRRPKRSEPGKIEEVLHASEIRLGSGTVLEQHTLYFEILTTTLFVIPLKLDEHGSSTDELQPSRYVWLYNCEKQHIGIADITDPAMLCQPTTTTSERAPMSVHVAILSGSCRNITHAAEKIRVGVETAKMIGFPGKVPQYYQVMLLKEHTPQSSRLKGACRLYERVGLGEVLVIMLERMGDLEWKGLLLQ